MKSVGYCGKKLSIVEIEQMISGASRKLKMLKVDVVGVHVATHVMNLVPMLERNNRFDPAVR